MGDSICSTQIIDGDGVYNASEMDNFVRTMELGECGLSYVVVSIMGPQISGKSTLLNHLFHTKFKEMDAFKGRSQTTKGIWLARCVDIEPCTIIMDLEGSDGRGHGEDDTSFGEQSALFAFAASDIVLINMWCHDIGREHAANKPLLRTVFQGIMRLFSLHKTTLLFIIRDKTKTPVENLEHMLRGDIQKIWDSVQKPLEYINTPLSEFFNIEVVALSSFEEKEEQFKEQVMISIVHCGEIANAKIVSFLNNEEWRHLEEAAQNGIVPGFAKKLSSILENCLIGYDKEAVYFDGNVRTLRKRQLESKLFQFVQPAYHSMLRHLVSKFTEDFKVRFIEALENGKVFVAAVNDCSQSSMFAFNEACEDIKQAIQDSLKVGYAKSVAESKEREEARRALMHIRDRFQRYVSYYFDST